MATLPEESLVVSERVRHTIWGIAQQAAMQMGLPVKMTPKTTLNEKFGVNITTSFTQVERPSAKYYVIGRGGHQMKRSSNNIDIPDPVDHDATDAALYDHLPFVLRRLNNDLSEVERSKYRLRVKKQIGGVDYWAYYARVFETDDNIKIVTETVKNGVTKEDPYVVTDANLSPVKPEISPRRSVNTSHTKIHVTTGSVIRFSREDARELMNACLIMYGSVNEAVISEIGIVSGVDVPNYASTDDSTRYTELKGATLISFISTFRALIYDNDGFTETLKLGEGAALLTNSPALATIGARPDTAI